jgi:hypothetical protein
MRKRTPSVSFLATSPSEQGQDIDQAILTPPLL